MVTAGPPPGADIHFPGGEDAMSLSSQLQKAEMKARSRCPLASTSHATRRRRLRRRRSLPDRKFAFVFNGVQRPPSFSCVRIKGAGSSAHEGVLIHKTENSDQARVIEEVSSSADLTGRSRERVNVQWMNREKK